MKVNIVKSEVTDNSQCECLSCRASTITTYTAKEVCIKNDVITIVI